MRKWTDQQTQRLGVFLETTASVKVLHNELVLECLMSYRVSHIAKVNGVRPVYTEAIDLSIFKI